MRHTRVLGIVLVIVLLLSTAAWAQGGGAGRGAASQAAPSQGTAPPQTAAAGRGGGRGGGGGGGADQLYAFDPTAAAGMPLGDAQPVETHQKVAAGGESMTYTARAGFLRLRNATTGQPAAYIFYTSYTRDGIGDASARPLVVFLGGAPGVASAWQEFGGFGPKRMKWAADVTAGAPPYGWTDNTSTLLGLADLVFANPVGTSLSRPALPARAPDFWTTTGDVGSMGEFVRGFLRESDRQSSPLFLAGDDAGTARAAGVAVLPHRPPDAGGRRGPAVDDAIGRRDRGGRAVHHDVPEPGPRRLASQEADAGSPGARRREDRRAGTPVRRARVPPRALQGRPHDAGGAHHASSRTWPV